MHYQIVYNLHHSADYYHFSRTKQNQCLGKNRRKNTSIRYSATNRAISMRFVIIHYRYVITNDVFVVVSIVLTMVSIIIFTANFAHLQTWTKLFRRKKVCGVSVCSWSGCIFSSRIDIVFVYQFSIYKIFSLRIGFSMKVL